MAEANQDIDDAYDPAPPEEYGDYNPESIDYEVQDDDASQDEEEYAHDDPSNEQAIEPEYVEPTSQPVDHPPPKSPSASRSPVARPSPIAPRSPSISRSPIASREYDPLEPQQALPVETAIDSAMEDDTVKSPDPGNVNDSHTMPSATTDAPQEHPSALPKSIDLQALLAGLVPARSKVSSPPQPREKPASPPSQIYPPGGLPPPAMNLPHDIMYQLQNLSSPPPQNAPQFQPPSSQPPQQSGAVDIQPQDLALTPQEEKLYEKFLQNEREVVQNARWEDFAPGSRMFIGNLPSDKIGKKDIFRLFYPYGRLAQISIKQAYGFVQFYEKADCDTAIRAQQGTVLTGRKIRISPARNRTNKDLEISKPQKKEGDGGRGGRQQRNRSPIGRDRSPPPAKNRARNRGRGGQHDDFEQRGRQNSRDFSPPGARYRRDDDYGRRYSRSRSPPGARYPASPRRTEPPEVALLVKDDPDRYLDHDYMSNSRAYIHHVEDMFEDRRIRTDTVFVTPRASVPDLTRQMVLEGAIAVVFLSRQLQDRRKISMQTFQRNPIDPGAIKWDEYNEIDIPIAVDLVAALKRGPPPVQQPPPFTGYPTQYPPQPPQPTLPAGVNPNLANIIGSMNPAALQKVFGVIAQQPPAAAYGGYNQPAVPGLLGQGSVLQGFGGQRAPQPTQQVQDIMAQLAALSKKT
jgi:nuclear polyadenylated RNA-binding protein 3